MWSLVSAILSVKTNLNFVWQARFHLQLSEDLNVNMRKASAPSSPSGSGMNSTPIHKRALLAHSLVEDISNNSRLVLLPKLRDRSFGSKILPFCQQNLLILSAKSFHFVSKTNLFCWQNGKICNANLFRSDSWVKWCEMAVIKLNPKSSISDRIALREQGGQRIQLGLESNSALG